MVVCWYFCLSVILSVILSVTEIAAQRMQFKCLNMHKWVQSHVLVFDVQLDLLTSKFSSLLDVFNDNPAYGESFYNSRVSGIPQYS